MKQSIRSGLLVVTGMALALAGGVFAVNNWNDTSVIADGSIIDAPIIKNNFDYLYERSWDFDGSNLSTELGVALGDTAVSGDLLLDVEGKVGAREYCDSEGNNCVTAQEVAQDLALPSCDMQTERLGWTGNEWQCVELNNASCSMDSLPSGNGETYSHSPRGGFGPMSQNTDHMRVIHGTHPDGEHWVQCINGTWETIWATSGGAR